MSVPAITNFGLHDLTASLLVGSIVLVVAVAAVRLSVRSGLPSLLLYLAIGLVLGEQIPALDFNDAALTQVLGYSALILILAEGGLATRWSSIRASVAPAFVLSTLGVVVSVAVVAGACHLLLHMPWPQSLLLGSILASTDAAAVFSVLRRVPLPRRIVGMLEAESGFNDAPVVILVTALAAHVADGGGESLSWSGLAVTAIYELALGAVLGVVIGYLGGSFLRRAATSSSGLFSIGVLAVIVLAYALTATLHWSGFIACYLAALVLGNMRLPHEAAVHGFSQGLGWLAQIGLFVLLGLLADVSGMIRELVPALVIGTVLLLVARPAAVHLSLAAFRVPFRSQVFLSWAGLRGAVPIVLATVPMTLGASAAADLFNLVFILVVVFTLVQGPTLPWVARRLGLTESDHSVALDVESTPVSDLGADLLSVRIGPASHLHGVEVFELRLPPGCNVTLIVRDETSFVPSPTTVLRHDDHLLVVAPNAQRDEADRRLRAVSRGGRLAGWA